MRQVIGLWASTLCLGLTSCQSSDSKTSDSKKSIDFVLSINSFTHSDPSEYREDGKKFFLRFDEFSSRQKMRKGKTGFGGIRDIPENRNYVDASACSLPDAIGYKKINVKNTSTVKANIVIGQAEKAKITFPNLNNATYLVSPLESANEPEGLTINLELDGEDLPIGSICILQIIPIIGLRAVNHPIERLFKYFEIKEGDLILKPGLKGATIFNNNVKRNELREGMVILMGNSTDKTGNIGFHSKANLKFDY